MLLTAPQLTVSLYVIKNRLDLLQSSNKKAHQNLPDIGKSKLHRSSKVCCARTICCKTRSKSVEKFTIGHVAARAERPAQLHHQHAHPHIAHVHTGHVTLSIS